TSTLSIIHLFPIMRISSNLTLFYKFFIPIFWIVLIGAITISVWVLPFRMQGVGTLSVRLAVTGIYLAGIAFLYWAVLRLNRVEVDASYIYVSNYFKTYRYPHRDILRVARKKRPLFPIAKIYLKGKGSLGSRILFVPASALYDEFLRTYSQADFLATEKHPA
ncbi:MAG: hypothetical protein AAF738_08190, partial [Bacteroidota bacterium]